MRLIPGAPTNRENNVRILGCVRKVIGQVATTSIFREMRPTYKEPFHGFTFTKFDGTTITV